MDARQHVLADMRPEGVDLGGVGLLQNLGKAAAQLGGVAVARHVDEAGDEAAEGIAPGEERDALPLLQAQDAERDVEELVRADLEQLVARVAVEDVEERLAVVARRIEARAFERAIDLAAQQ